MKLNFDYPIWADDWSSSNESFFGCVCATLPCVYVCLCVHMCLLYKHCCTVTVFVCVIVCSCKSVHDGMSDSRVRVVRYWHISAQRWDVIISSLSMQFQQHGNHSREWIWNKFPMHWSGDFRTQTHTHTSGWNNLLYFSHTRKYLAQNLPSFSLVNTFHKWDHSTWMHIMHMFMRTGHLTVVYPVHGSVSLPYALCWSYRLTVND